MVRLSFKNLSVSTAALAFIFGFIVTLGTGLLRNDGITIPEIQYYGYPLPWLIEDLNGPTKYIPSNMIFNIVLWTIFVFIFLTILERAVSSTGISSRES